MQSYGFVPGGTCFERAAQAYVRLRKDTKILATTSDVLPIPLFTLQQFIAEVATGSQTSLPVQDFFLVTHGTHVGAMELPLDTQHTGMSFEEVDATTTAGAINIPANVVIPRQTTGGGVPIPCVVNIVGCFAGAFDPYMRRLRQALGGATLGAALGVAAPMNWDSFLTERESLPLLAGMLRYMLYDFRAAGPDPFTSRADLLQALAQRQYQRIDGSVVPAAVWEKAVPTDFNTYGRRLLLRTVKLKPAINGQKTIRVNSVYDYGYEKTGPFVFTGGPSAVSLPATRRAFVLSQLQGWPAFQPGYALPFYQRFGFTSLNDFVDGFNWLPTNVPLLHPSDHWYCYRYLYMCGVPVVDPANDEQNLLCDYVSSDGTVQRLDLSNTPTLFARVFA